MSLLSSFVYPGVKWPQVEVYRGVPVYSVAYGVTSQGVTPTEKVFFYNAGGVWTAYTDGPYGPIGVNDRLNVGVIELAIDRILSGQPVGTAATYRGVDIYQDPLTLLYYFTVNSQKHQNYATIAAAKADIDILLGSTTPTTGTTPTTPTPPPGSNLSVAATYRGVTIYQDNLTGLFSLTLGTTTYPDVASLAYAEGLVDSYATTHSEISPAPSTGVTPDAQYLGSLQLQQGNPGTLGGDPARATLLEGQVNATLAAIGLTPDALSRVDAAEDKEKAASELLTVISGLSVGAIAGLEVVGIVAEIVGLGQIETVTTAINEIIDAIGLKEFTAKIFNMKIERQLIAPAEHYLNSVYTPEHPGEGQLLDYLFKRLITVNQYIAEMAKLGFNATYSSLSMTSHYQRLNLVHLATAENRGIITEAQAGRGLERLPVNFTAWDEGDVSDGEVLWELEKTPIGKLDLRKAYLYKLIDDNLYTQRLKGLGYREDTALMERIQAQAAIYSLQSACITQAGGKYTDAIADALKDQTAAEKILLNNRDAALKQLDADYAAQALTPAQYTNNKAQILAQTDQAIAQVVAQFEPRRTAALDLLKEDVSRIKAVVDPDELTLLRYVMAGERKLIPSSLSDVIPEVSYEGEV